MKEKDTATPEIIGSYRKVIALEDKQLLKRRKKLYGEGEDAEKLKKTKFGIALSGGGIRSATINLGFLKTLNKFGILKRADYLSTVSGGGYTGAYVQATLKNEGDFNQLFADQHIEYMRSRGEYLVPGKKVEIKGANNSEVAKEKPAKTDREDDLKLAPGGSSVK